jgi:putative phosphoesterase
MSDVVHVLVTSDTHLTLGAKLPDDLLRLADRADHIVHAGDFVTLDVLDTLEALAPVTAVHGNVCDGATASRLPERAEVELGGVRIGVVHDPGMRIGRHERLRGWFPGCGVVVYGHTHMPELARVGSSDGAVLIVNPGSPTQRRRAPSHTACWLELAGGRVAAADLVVLGRAGGA